MGNSGNYRRLCHTVGSGRLSSTQSPPATADTEAEARTDRSYKETDKTIHQVSQQNYFLNNSKPRSCHYINSYPVNLTAMYR